MSWDFIKHPSERPRFRVDFSDRLNTGEALTGTPSVEVLEGEAWGGTDVTNTYLDGTPTIVNGSSVEFWLAADAANQDAGLYSLVVRADTDSQRKLVAKDGFGRPVRLRVTA